MTIRGTTGPTTAEGKRKMPLNRVSHGVTVDLVLPHEDKQVFDSLIEKLRMELHPDGPVEFAILYRIALTIWRQQRLAMAEAANLREQYMQDFAGTDQHKHGVLASQTLLDTYTRYQTSLDSQLFKLLRKLKDYQAEKRKDILS